MKLILFDQFWSFYRPIPSNYQFGPHFTPFLTAGSPTFLPKIMGQIKKVPDFPPKTPFLLDFLEGNPHSSTRKPLYRHLKSAFFSRKKHRLNRWRMGISQPNWQPFLCPIIGPKKFTACFFGAKIDFFLSPFKGLFDHSYGQKWGQKSTFSPPFTPHFGAQNRFIGPEWEKKTLNLKAAHETPF